jgi:hypothetical protein
LPNGAVSCRLGNLCDHATRKLRGRLSPVTWSATAAEQWIQVQTE